MQFLVSAPTPRFHAPQPALVPGHPRQAPAARPEVRGWFDSSLDLAQGLEVTEHDCDALYELWRLARS